jgi:hypothetical protein
MTIGKVPKGYVMSKISSVKTVYGLLNFNIEDYIHNGMYINSIVKHDNNTYTLLYSNGNTKNVRPDERIQVVSLK